MYVSAKKSSKAQLFAYVSVQFVQIKGLDHAWLQNTHLATEGCLVRVDNMENGKEKKIKKRKAIYYFLETDFMCKFLEPDTDIMGERQFMHHAFFAPMLRLTL